MVFGFVKKVFKGVGKVFKAIGKGIKKGFKKFGKIMNKLGIIGQIGMMFIAPHIGAFAMKGLSALGSGFMSGLASYSGVGSTLTKFAHGVLSNAANIAKTGISAVRSITDTIGGVIADSTRTVGSKLTGGWIKPLNHATAGTFESQSWYGKILENAKVRGTQGLDRTINLARDAGAEFTASLPGGEKYAPRYEKFTDPDAKFFKTQSREVTYDSANKRLLQQNILDSAAADPEVTSISGMGTASDTPTLRSLLDSPYNLEDTRASFGQENITPKNLFQTTAEDINLGVDKMSVNPDPIGGPDLTQGAIQPEKNFFARAFEAAKPTAEDVGHQVKGQLTNLALDLVMPDKEKQATLAGGPITPTNFDRIFANTIARQGSGLDFQGRFALGEELSEEQIAMNNYLQIANNDAYWDSQTNSKNMLLQQQRNPNTLFFSNFIG